MITCSQCGRENEIFFKFCLGCGAELVAGAPSKPKPAARTVSPRKGPARVRTGLVSVSEPAAEPAEKAAPPAAAPRHDTVETPAVSEPEAPAAEGVDTAEPAARPEVSEPAEAATEPPPAEAATESPAAEAATEPPAAEAATEPPAAEDETRPCPSCNKPVEAGHLFCKSCGTRMDQPPQPAEASVAVDQRTHVTAARMGKLVLIRADRSDGAMFPLYEGINSFGRDETDISFPQDDFLAPRHLDVVVEPGRVRIQPYPTVNGTFYRIRSAVQLHSGDQFRIGQELLQLEFFTDVSEALNEDGTAPIGAALPETIWGRLLILVGSDTVASAFLLSGDEIVLGRETGHITFPRDGYVSGRHAALRRAADGRVTLVDLGSSNGTYYRTKSETTLASGDMLLAGQQLFRVQL